MSWRDNLQTASFRGVSFYVESLNYSGGRRNIIREYPQRDKASAEDNGLSIRKLPVTGFLVGETFIADHKRLIDALETAGSGTLIHPFYGEKTVVLSGDFTVSITSDNGGMCTITMPFVEASAPSYPTSAIDTVGKARQSADLLGSAARNLFADKFTLADMPDFVRESAIGKIGEMTGSITGALKSIVPGIDGMAGSLMDNVHTLIDHPSELANAIGSLIGSVRNVLDIPGRASSMVGDMLRSVGIGKSSNSGNQHVDAGSVARTLVTVAQNSGSAADPVKPLFNTPARRQEAANENAIDELVRNEALSNAAGAATVMPPVVYDDMTDVRDTVTAAIEKEALYAPVKTYEALHQLRIDIYKDMTDRASDLARLREITLPQVMPALVIAYDLYETAERADEIVERNKIVNPAFVPPAPIKVLTQ